MNEVAAQTGEVSPQCRNCGSPLVAGQSFCGQCGQRGGAQRLTVGGIGHDLVHAFFHVDNSILALLKGLLTRPGQVARDYVDGRRKRYFGPFGFVVIMTGLATFFVSVAHVEWFKPITDSEAQAILTRHINLVILLQTPVLSALCMLLFRKERLNYAEHLVLVAYTTGIRVMYMSFVAIPVMSFTHRTAADPAVVVGYYGPWLLYFTIAARQFYGGPAAPAAVKGIIAVVVNQLLTMVGIYVFIYTYQRMTH